MFLLLRQHLITNPMDELLAAMLRGCATARRLESELHIGSHNVQLLRATCEEISVLFGTIAERLGQHEMPSAFAGEVLAGLRRGGMHEAVAVSRPALSLEVPVAVPTGGAEEVPGGGSGGATPTSAGQRSSRRRRDRDVTVTLRVPAPRSGNLDIPPDDGYTWRKYGQKDIFNSRFPRAYYRCTHKTFYGCDAKKQVQRLDDDPFTYEVTYRGEHTCHTSPTPLVLPEIAVGQGRVAPQPAQPLSWAPSGGPSTSHARAVRELEWPVADMADVMFNTGSGGTGAMDAIFDVSYNRDR